MTYSSKYLFGSSIALGVSFCSSSSAIRTACDIQIEGRWGAGRPKLTWKKLAEEDCRE